MNPELFVTLAFPDGDVVQFEVLQVGHGAHVLDLGHIWHAVQNGIPMLVQSADTGDQAWNILNKDYVVRVVDNVS
jgi:hypothetical protein